MMEAEKAQKKGSKNKVVIAVVAIIVVIGGIFGFRAYMQYMAPNVSGKQAYLYVKTGSKYEDLLADLRQSGALDDVEGFASVANKMGLKDRLKPGKYKLKKGMGNRSLINMLKSGNQEAVKLKVQGMRLQNDMIGYVSKNIEADSLSLVHLLDSASLIGELGFNKDNVYTMFLPNTYEMYWNTSAEQFIKRMNKEYEKFWNADRKQKAAAMNLSPIQVTILASIVDGEALHDAEMPTIAGLYFNRLQKGIRLQADPTVIFANKDFTVKRVTGKLLSVESPYNTYRVSGLPPGPIMMPSIKAIDATLNYSHNNYIYMCAKEDFSGDHNFAATKEEHEKNAARYREALNKRGIFK